MNQAAANPAGQTVLVTGGSGYVGGWVAVGLLRRGYHVRATIRNLAREAEVRAMIGNGADVGDRLEIVQANLLDDAGWNEAAAGVDAVMHVASPMPIGEFRNQDIITPARMGTLRVLRAAAQNGVRRVVLTSSTSAASSKDKSVTADESVWTDLPDEPIYKYPRAKTLAEQDAWAFVRDQGGRMELSTVLPAQIQGPVLGSDFSASVGIVQMMLRGKMPVMPRSGFCIVDIRDLVDLHIAAMEAPEAAGERFIAAGEFLWFRDVARILKDALGERAAKVSTRELPNWLVRFGGLFNPEMKQLGPNLGVKSLSSSAKAKEMLGWTSRPARESIVDAANSLMEKGLV